MAVFADIGPTVLSRVSNQRSKCLGFVSLFELLGKVS
jgi:hypothetical protein